MQVEKDDFRFITIGKKMPPFRTEKDLCIGVSAEYDTIEINLKGLYYIDLSFRKTLSTSLLILRKDLLVVYRNSCVFYFQTEADMLLFKLKYGL